MFQNTNELLQRGLTFDEFISPNKDSLLLPKSAPRISKSDQEKAEIAALAAGSIHSMDEYLNLRADHLVSKPDPHPPSYSATTPILTSKKLIPFSMDPASKSINLKSKPSPGKARPGRPLSRSPKPASRSNSPIVSRSPARAKPKTPTPNDTLFETFTKLLGRTEKPKKQNELYTFTHIKAEPKLNRTKDEEVEVEPVPEEEGSILLANDIKKMIEDENELDLIDELKHASVGSDIVNADYKKMKDFLGYDVHFDSQHHHNKLMSCAPEEVEKCEGFQELSQASKSNSMEEPNANIFLSVEPAQKGAKEKATPTNTLFSVEPERHEDDNKGNPQTSFGRGGLEENMNNSRDNGCFDDEDDDNLGVLDFLKKVETNPRELHENPTPHISNFSNKQKSQNHFLEDERPNLKSEKPVSEKINMLSTFQSSSFKKPGEKIPLSARDVSTSVQTRNTHTSPPPENFAKINDYFEKQYKKMKPVPNREEVEFAKPLPKREKRDVSKDQLMRLKMERIQDFFKSCNF